MKTSMYFGIFGGQYVPETLVPALDELETAYLGTLDDASFNGELLALLQNYSGRPTPLWFAPRITESLGGAKVYLKREDLNHTGAHKINNALGQVLLASKMGKKRIIAETGAGQHGVAVATAAALFGLECVVYMGEEDVHRQAPNVARMHLLGTKVVSVLSGTRTLKDAVNEAIRDWVTNVEDSFYVIGSVMGPHPYPPMGIFHAFIGDPGVALVGVEAAGRGVDTGLHAATISGGKPGVLHGSYSYVLFDEDGQIQPAHSISAGLDYPGVGPEHSHLAATGRATYVSVTDDEAVEAFHRTCRLEGIIPALESSHALAHVYRTAAALPKETIVLVNLSGRGDKDMDTILSL